MGLALFLGGCTFLLNSEELLQACVTEIDCADGFYCDDGACLPGEAPLPFNPEEPNLPTFNDDAGAPPEDPAQGTHDAGHNSVAATDAGTAAISSIDSGVAPVTADDAGTPLQEVSDAGTPLQEVSDAGNDSVTDVENDAGQDVAPTVDAGTTEANLHDAGAQEGPSGSASDGGQSTTAVADAG